MQSLNIDCIFVAQDTLNVWDLFEQVIIIINIIMMVFTREPPIE
jgi:hypothetical protein